MGRWCFLPKLSSLLFLGMFHVEHFSTLSASERAAAAAAKAAAGEASAAAEAAATPA